METINADESHFQAEFMLEEGGRLYPVRAWVEDNDGFPSLNCRHKISQLGITLANYRGAGTIDELVLISREFYKVMRQCCYLPPKELPYGSPVSEWVARVLESMRTGRDLVLEARG